MGGLAKPSVAGRRPHRSRTVLTKGWPRPQSHRKLSCLSKLSGVPQGCLVGGNNETRSVGAGRVLRWAAGRHGRVAQDYSWKPDRPVTIIVPWAAGGSTDQMARIVASELEAELKQKFIVVNQPGASGSIGTKNAVEAPKDGYTWAAGAATDVGTYRVLGLLDSGLKDWHMFFAVANLTAIAANPARRSRTSASCSTRSRRAAPTCRSPPPASPRPATTSWSRSRPPPRSTTSTSPTTAATRPCCRPCRARPRRSRSCSSR